MPKTHLFKKRPHMPWKRRYVKNNTLAKHIQGADSLARLLEHCYQNLTSRVFDASARFGLRYIRSQIALSPFGEDEPQHIIPLHLSYACVSTYNGG